MEEKVETEFKYLEKRIKNLENNQYETEYWCESSVKSNTVMSVSNEVLYYENEEYTTKVVCRN
jgi:glutamine cyclotransferase